MRLSLTHVGNRFSGKDGWELLTQGYLRRCEGFASCQTEAFRSEEAWLEWVARQDARTAAVVVVLDRLGKAWSSEAFAGWLGARRDEGSQHVVFAIGPASGWSELGRRRAVLMLSLGPMTMAHGLARLVMAEQIYRAVTILSGHPYHAGH